MYKTNNKMRFCDCFHSCRKKGAVKKSATKPVDSLDMEAHGL